MIDISSKDIVRRYARASGFIRLQPETLNEIRNGTVKKGDVVESSKIAAVMGAKEAWMRLPYCHQVPIEGDNSCEDVRAPPFQTFPDSWR